MKEMRGEMQSMGLGLQTGLDKMKSIMAAPHGRDTEPMRGSVDCVGPAMQTGEVTIIRETCWARLVEVMEKVTVTEREKLNEETETCRARHVETRR